MTNIEHILKSLTKASAVLMKLTKKNMIPCLSFEAKLHDHTLVQDVPIRILNIADMENYHEPVISEPDIQLEFTESNHPKNVRTVAERMRSFDKLLDVEVDKSGILILSVHTDLAVMKTYFNNIKVRGDNGLEQSLKVRVDNKRFSKLFHMEALHPDSVVFCVTQNEAIILHAALEKGAGTITFYMPIYDSGGDGDGGEGEGEGDEN